MVATPIGNLEDITLRALRILKEVDLLAAEDTRQTRKLLKRYEINTPLTSFHQHTSVAKQQELLSKLRSGLKIALVTDSGTPGISDPGALLVALARQAGVPVIPIPGASAVTAALSVCGFPAQRFRFEGFPPRKAGKLRRFFEALLEEADPIVLYESPARLTQTLQTALEVLGDRPIVICRELTKQFEEIFSCSLSKALEHYRQKTPRGEFTLVIGKRSVI